MNRQQMLMIRKQIENKTRMDRIQEGNKKKTSKEK